jgi:hypothetical protein
VSPHSQASDTHTLVTPILSAQDQSGSDSGKLFTPSDELLCRALIKAGFVWSEFPVPSSSKISRSSIAQVIIVPSENPQITSSRQSFSDISEGEKGVQSQVESHSSSLP